MIDLSTIFFEGEDMAVFKLPKVEPQEIIYYGEDKENNCADVFYSLKNSSSSNILVMLLHGGYWTP